MKRSRFNTADRQPLTPAVAFDVSHPPRFLRRVSVRDANSAAVSLAAKCVMSCVWTLTAGVVASASWQRSARLSHAAQRDTAPAWLSSLLSTQRGQAVVGTCVGVAETVARHGMARNAAEGVEGTTAAAESPLLSGTARQVLPPNGRLRSACTVPWVPLQPEVAEAGGSAALHRTGCKGSSAACVWCLLLRRLFASNVIVVTCAGCHPSTESGLSSTACSQFQTTTSPCFTTSLFCVSAHGTVHRVLLCAALLAAVLAWWLAEVAAPPKSKTWPQRAGPPQGTLSHNTQLRINGD